MNFTRRPVATSSVSIVLSWVSIVLDSANVETCRPNGRSLKMLEDLAADQAVGVLPSTLIEIGI